MLLLTIAAFAATPQPQATQPAPGDELICKRVTATGTKFAKRVCRKRAEIEAQAERDRRDLSELQMGPKINPPSGPGT